MNSHLIYLLILILSLAGPLALSFDKKVAFYKQWKFVFPAMLLPAAFFIVWDILFTRQGVWTFNPAYLTGIYLVNIPLEEALFFFVVPYCCVFIYECIRCYRPHITANFTARTVFQMIGICLLIVAVFNYGRAYTYFTFMFTAAFIAILFIFRRWFTGFHIGAFLLAYAIILLPFLAVNGVLTALPVVSYSNTQTLGIRIFTIPFEDVFYGMLLVMMNIAIFEKLRSRSKAHR
jgi:lycopene cyclase domain-containing protein